MIEKKPINPLYSSRVDAYDKGVKQFEYENYDDPDRERREAERRKKQADLYRAAYKKLNNVGDSQFERLHSKPGSNPIPLKEDRGFFGDVFSHVMRGAVNVVGQTGHALSLLDADPDNEGVGKSMAGWAEKTMREQPSLVPDKAEAEGTDGIIYRGLMGAAESLPLSLVPFGAGLGGAAAAGKVAKGLYGASKAVGAARKIGGAAVGTGALIGLFGGGEYGAAREQALRYLDENRPDLSDEERKQIAHKHGLISGVAEAGTELATDFLALRFFGGRFVADGITKSLKQMMAPGFGGELKAFAKSLGKTAVGEVAGEEAATYLQTESAKRVGMGEGFTLDAAIDTAAAAIWLTAGLGLGIHGYNSVQKGQALTDLNSEDPSTRVHAAQIVAGNIAEEDEGVAKQWLDAVVSKIEKGESIDVNENALSLVEDRLDTENRLKTAPSVLVDRTGTDEYKGVEYQTARYRTVDELIAIAESPKRMEEFGTNPEEMAQFIQTRARYEDIAKGVSEADEQSRKDILEALRMDSDFNEDIVRQDIEDLAAPTPEEIAAQDKTVLDKLSKEQQVVAKTLLDRIDSLSREDLESLDSKAISSGNPELADIYERRKSERLAALDQQEMYDRPEDVGAGSENDLGPVVSQLIADLRSPDERKRVPPWLEHKAVRLYNTKNGTNISLNRDFVIATLQKVRSKSPLTQRQEEAWGYIQQATGIGRPQSEGTAAPTGAQQTNERGSYEEENRVSDREARLAEESRRGNEPGDKSAQEGIPRQDGAAEGATAPSVPRSSLSDSQELDQEQTGVRRDVGPGEAGGQRLSDAREEAGAEQQPVSQEEGTSGKSVEELKKITVQHPTLNSEGELEVKERPADQAIQHEESFIERCYSIKACLG